MNSTHSGRGSGRALQPRTKKTPQTMRVFRNIREPMVVDARASPLSSYDVTSSSGGGVATYIPLSPLGVAVLQYVSTASGSPVTLNPVSFCNPTLPWLYNQARGFERYRVLRAKLIVVGNSSSTIVGRMAVSSSTDVADVAGASSALTIANSVGGRTFDLSTLATKEQTLALDIDSSWKKVSGATGIAIGPIPLVTSTVNDLCFSNVTFVVAGAPASTLLATFFLDYDVEFKDPISITTNV